MNKNKHEQFLEFIKDKREELLEDLLDLPLRKIKEVGDFGCGRGFFTWCLKHEIPNSACVGIDTFDPKTPPDFYEFSIDIVRNFFKEYADESIDFVKGNLVTGENLPSEFDLIYCKRVLFNIYNHYWFDELKKSIDNIANALKSCGWLCLIEIQETKFKEILEKNLKQANFEFNTPRCVYRKYETLEKPYEKYPYLIYQCKKGK